MKMAQQSDTTTPFFVTLFHCVSLLALCSAKGGKSCQWVKNSGQFADGEFQFLLPHSLSPFAEENTTLEVTAEAMTDHLIFIKKTKSFYLRDISK